jgi:hypothetical protein
LPSNEARVIGETLAAAQRENFRVNVIEAFDQPWKRWLEGAVGGHWGVFSRAAQAPKFILGGAVSDHPHWMMQGIAGILLAALTFGAAWIGGRGQSAPPLLWPRIAALAFLPAILFGWTLETVPAESFSVGSWLRGLAFAVMAAAAPIVCAPACAVGRPLPAFAALLRRSDDARDGLSFALGVSFIALTLLSVQTAFGLVFDPRYRDIPFAAQSAAVIPFLVLILSAPRPAGGRAMAEMLGAAVLALAAGYIVLNETLANWQAIWLCAGFAGLAVILLRARDAPG